MTRGLCYDVRMSRLVEAVLALGSNLGPRAQTLAFALHALAPIHRCSQVFETAPVGGPDGQGPFYNLVAVVHTALSPLQLLSRCQAIEAQAGRTRSVHWGARTLDIDLLFYGDQRIDSVELIVPHPRLHERRFVLHPLFEVAPERCPPDWNARLPSAIVEPRGSLELLLATANEHVSSP